MMLRTLRRAGFRALQTSGVSAALARSSWRRRRLLILCYHGVSSPVGIPAHDEHEWQPMLYMTQDVLVSRFRLIKNSGCEVLPLGEALKHLYAGTLPSKSVAITFDDGGFDFYRAAYPVVRDFGFPVTVYQTTYYSDFPRPIFNLACSYLLWKGRAQRLQAAPELGIPREADLSSDVKRREVLNDLNAFAEQQNYSGAAKDELAAKLATLLGQDYEAFCASRLFQLMTPAEIRELSTQGVEFQLHTHRHRTPKEEGVFRREIRENRQRLEEITGKPATHFCYPSGIYRGEFLPWLRQEGVTSATTCEPSLVAAATNPLLLPRLVDTSFKTALEFESWLDGTGALLARRPPARARMNHD
jgi:peptidoglycan/xylan/chitin deacetylase (PgdA/CDA1 family)